MGILIRNSATEAKVRKFAKRTRRTLTAAIDFAIDAQLANLAPPRRKKGRIDRKKLADILA
jgi:hypothetical protein